MVHVVTDVFKPLPVQLPPVRCSCIDSCGRCDSVRAGISFSQSYPSLTEGIAPYTSLIDNLGTLYRPAPLRPVPRGKSNCTTNVQHI